MAFDAGVIVVGGGPAGASAAHFLARAGADVLLLDRARFPRDKPCAEYLSPQASRLLDTMGILADVEREAAPLAGMRVRAPSGVEIHGEFAAQHGFAGFRDRGLAIRRMRLDAIVLDSARRAGARVLEETLVRDLERDASGRVAGVVGQQHDGVHRSYRAPLVIGADGLRSVIARRAALARYGRWPHRMALVAHYTEVDGVGDCGEMHVVRDGYAGLADVGGGVTNVAVVVPCGAARSMAGDAAGFLEGFLARVPRVASRLTSAQRIGPVRAVGPFNWRARTAWAPGVTLVGDAADFFDPFTGEGIYTALRGGELLAHFAARAIDAAPRAADDALRAYDTARRREFGGKWNVERAIGVAVAFPALINHAARALASRKELADLLVGVTGDFVPASEVLRPGYVWRVVAGGLPWGRRAARVRAAHDVLPQNAARS